MESMDSTLYCDATGMEIHNRYDALTIPIVFSRRTLTSGESEIHLSPAAHKLPFEQLVERSYTAYIDQSHRPVMIEEMSTTREIYHGPQTADPAVQHLFNTLNQDVSLAEKHPAHNGTSVPVDEY